MASVLTHAFVAVASGRISGIQPASLRLWMLAITSSILPDADVIGFALGIDYGDMLGHRGLSHSLFFALVWSLLVALLGFKDMAKCSRKWWGLFAFIFVATASHGILDAMTNGGLGVAFFAPFFNSRYFFPWRPIIVSPIGVSSFFSRWGAAVLLSEIKFVWIPFTSAWLFAWLLRKAMSRPEKV